MLTITKQINESKTGDDGSKTANNPSDEMHPIDSAPVGSKHVQPVDPLPAETSDSADHGNVTNEHSETKVQTDETAAPQAPGVSSASASDFVAGSHPADSAPLKAANTADASQLIPGDKIPSEAHPAHDTHAGASQKSKPAEGPVKHNTKFVPGQSGNPKGRPLGSRNKTTLLREHLRDGEEEQVIDDMIAAALGGDKVARKALYDCLYPKCKERTIQLDLGPVQNFEHVAPAVSKIILAASSGKITLGEAEKLIKLLYSQMDLIYGTCGRW